MCVRVCIRVRSIRTKSRESHRECAWNNRDNQRGKEMTRTTRATTKLDLHLLRMVVYTFRRPTTIQTFSSRDTSTRFRQSLYGLDAQLFAPAWTQRVHHQQNQIRMANLLHAERPANIHIHLWMLRQSDDKSTYCRLSLYSRNLLDIKGRRP